MEKKRMDMELVQNYLEGTLKEKDRIAANQRLVDDEKFRQLFDHMELMIDGIRDSGSKSLLQEKVEKLESALDAMDSESEEEETDDHSNSETVIVPWYASTIWRAIAASTALVMVVWLVFNSTGPMSNDEIAENFLEPHENVMGSRGAIQPSMIDQAYEAYGIGDYERAVVLLEQGTEYSSEEITGLFYLGNAYLQLGEGAKAVSSFQKVIDFGQGWVIDSKWYMAFGYLQLAENEKARELFVEIRDGGEEYLDYREDAKKVLLDME